MYYDKPNIILPPPYAEIREAEEDYQCFDEYFGIFDTNCLDLGGYPSWHRGEPATSTATSSTSSSTSSAANGTATTSTSSSGASIQRATTTTTLPDYGFNFVPRESIIVGVDTNWNCKADAKFNERELRVNT